ncbi:MAG: cofactor-independent phosphoglycerate mutase [Deltaproteobacteria bacterium]|nr:cofactor-independent phosphoglycerate mutase [Deltaproteobacteria bacterium]MBW2084782.1 cofactor-independent phosphoglycerate mutase [Deltaproteobacteria bacterium]
MKYAILVGDGMGDYAIPELGNQTPLESADTPHMDALAQGGLLGLVRTIPKNMEAGSDVANLSIMGYDPAVYHTGRAPLEAASMGVSLADNEVAFRLNLINLTFKRGGHLIMRDHSAGNISTAEAHAIIEDLAGKLPLEKGQKIYPGVSYRHLLVWPGLKSSLPTIAPHDYLDQDVTAYLNQSGEMKPLLDLIQASWPLLEKNPVNLKRKAKGLLVANSIWPWGQGRGLTMPTYQERWGINGAVVSAVDLIKGLGVYAGLKPINVPGATGFIDTDYEAKVKAALNSLKRTDLVFLHIEAPDEASHQGNLQEKIKAIEFFDSRVVGPMRAGLIEMGDFRMLILCDHFTPISVKTHTPEPVPFIIFPGPLPSNRAYSEKQASEAGIYFEQGHTLIDLFLDKQK